MALVCGLAVRYLQAGSRVPITGRNPQKLDKVAQPYPGLLTFVNDIGISEEREKLDEYVVKIMPEVV